MDLHYLLIGICIAIIVFYQLRIYARTSKRRKQFGQIFPENAEDEWFIFKKDGVQIVSKQLENLEGIVREAGRELPRLLSKINDCNTRIGRLKVEHANALIFHQTEDIFFYENAINEETSKRDDLMAQKKDWEDKRSEAKKQIETLENAIENPGEDTRSIIIVSINKYLEKNKKSVTDFNLIRDIIDRNSDAVEEEIQTQIPIPLYFGLMGTMLGILIGVLFLVASGSLKSLLSSYEAPAKVEQLSMEDRDFLKSKHGEISYEDVTRELSESEKRELRTRFDEEASNGVNALFGGVALAMLSSIIGILLTTVGSIRTKNIKVHVERKKHAFISWLQVELLPKISTDFSSALVQLGRDLSGFNNSFSSNANLLKNTISDISKTTIAQSDLLKSIERLDIEKIAQANITVYEGLTNCTQDIASMAKDLREIESSIKGVGEFMEDGINEYEKRYTFIQDASGKVDLEIQKGHTELAKAANSVFEKYDALLNTLYMHSESMTKDLAEKYDAQAEALHKSIVDKLSDVRQLENELKNLVAVKTGISNLEKATKEQNQKLDRLTSAIQELAHVKASGGSVMASMELPRLYRVLIIIATSVISIVGGAFIIQLVLRLF